MPPRAPGPPPEAPLPPAYETLRAAIERGRAGRGGRAGPAWSRLRALVLAYAAQGMLRARIGGILGVSTQRVTQLREEGCDAVLRGGSESPQAEAACADRWRRWCAAGDAAACARLRRMAEPSAG
jgi:hypothetical protein